MLQKWQIVRVNFRMQRATWFGLTIFVSIMPHCAVEGHSKARGDDVAVEQIGQPVDLARLAFLDGKEIAEIAVVADGKPKIDLDIPFGVDTAILSVEAKKNSVGLLGRAMSSPDLAGSTFVIAGCTDGLESEVYSQSLSERRADAVKQELMTTFSIPSENLVTVGYGSSKLKNPENPFDPVNNRVLVVNMASKSTK